MNDDTINLLYETLEVLDQHGKTPKDVCWIKRENTWCTWEDFAEEANKRYNNGFGGNEVVLSLIIGGEDFWLERREYDGSEWWKYRTRPEKPEKQVKKLGVFNDER